MEGIERPSLQHMLSQLRYADVIVLVMDVNKPVSKQEFRLSEMIAKEGKASVIVVNKLDLIPKKTNSLSRKQCELLKQLRPLNWAPVIFTSAKTQYKSNAI